MEQRITWVGIDDDKLNLTVAVVRGEDRDADIRRLANEDRALRRWVRRLVREADGGEIRMCYEAGPNGFALLGTRTEVDLTGRSISARGRKAPAPTPAEPPPR